MQGKTTDLHDMAAEAVLHDGLEAAPGDALQQAVIPLLCISLGPQHGGDESLQGFSARQTTSSALVTPYYGNIPTHPLLEAKVPLR